MKKNTRKILALLVAFMFAMTSFSYADETVNIGENVMPEQEVFNEDADQEQSAEPDSVIPDGLSETDEVEESHAGAIQESAAFEQSGSVNGVNVTVRAEQGVFPSGAELFVKPYDK